MERQKKKQTKQKLGEGLLSSQKDNAATANSSSICSRKEDSTEVLGRKLLTFTWTLSGDNVYFLSIRFIMFHLHLDFNFHTIV